jgi:hypothetical protein
LFLCEYFLSLLLLLILLLLVVCRTWGWNFIDLIPS